MAIAEASQSRLAYVPEVIPGVIPANPTFQVLRFVSEGIRLAKQTVVSDEIRADGNVTDIADVGRSVEGPIAGEFSYGTFDDLFASLMRGSWDEDVLVNGLEHKSFAFEKTFEQGATDSYIRYRGCRVNTLDLALETRQIIKANFGIMGLGSPVPTSAIIAGATYTPPTTVSVLNAATNLGALTVTGIATSPKIKTLNLQARANLYANDVLGAYDVDSHGLGRFEVSGNMVVYFANLDTYNAVLNHDDVGLSFNLGSVSGEKYTIDLPKVKLMEGSPLVPGNSQAVMMDIPYQAKFDSGIGGTMRITRAVV